jgi:choline-sulfatase
MGQPNILLIMADQLTALALPSYGHPVVRAPHITALAEEGVLFETAYCNSPLVRPVPRVDVDRAAAFAHRRL